MRFIALLSWTFLLQASANTSRYEPIGRWCTFEHQSDWEYISHFDDDAQAIGEMLNADGTWICADHEGGCPFRWFRSKTGTVGYCQAVESCADVMTFEKRDGKWVQTSGHVTLSCHSVPATAAPRGRSMSSRSR